MSANLSMETEALRKRNIALSRSVLYETLSMAFRPPEEASVRVLRTEGIQGAIIRAASVLDEESDGRLEMPARRFVRAMNPDRGEDGPVGPNASPETYRQLFGHTVRGPVPPYETEYGDGTLFQKPQEMSDLGGFFSAFGLKVSPTAHERIDHVSCELEFLAFITRKEAHSIEIADTEMTARTRDAGKLFLVDHLARFVPAFARRLSRQDPDGFYGRAGDLCREFVRSDCARLGARLGPETLPLRVAADDGKPMTCGTADECATAGCPPALEGPDTGAELLQLAGEEPADREERC